MTSNHVERIAGADLKHEKNDELEVSDAFWMRRPRKRAVLTHQQASMIFEMRGSVFNEAKSSRATAFTARSVMVSRMFGVSSKTVRDIWNKRTWRHCTEALWTKEGNDFRQFSSTAWPIQVPQATTSLRRVGRPCGSKDTKPRKPRGARIIATVGDKQREDKQPAFFVSSCQDGVLCGEDTAMFDPDIVQIIPPVDRCKGTLQEKIFWKSSITTYASSAGLEPDDEADLRRTFPFFLDV
jgi:hypothetical protein